MDGWDEIVMVVVVVCAEWNMQMCAEVEMQAQVKVMDGPLPGEAEGKRRGSGGEAEEQRQETASHEINGRTCIN